MIRRIVSLGVIALILGVLGCENLTGSDDGGQAAPIRVGVVGAHTGGLEEFGIPTLRAANLIADAANDDGGVLGRRVEIVAVDDQCDRTRGEAAAQEAVDAGVVAVVGHTCSGATGQALSVYAQSGIPVISPSATRPTLTTDGAPFFFRTIVPDFEDTKTMIDALVAEGAANVYVLYDATETDWDADAIAFVESQISGVATHVASSGIDFTNGTEITSEAATIESSAADGVLLLPVRDGAQGAEVADVVNALRDATFSGAVAATRDGSEQDLITNLNDPSGVLVVERADPLGTSAAAALDQDHVNEYGQNGGPFFIEGGAALEVLLAAMEQTGRTSAGSLTTAIENGTFTTVLGEIEFIDGNPSGGQTGYVIYEISAGSFVEYSP